MRMKGYRRYKGRKEEGRICNEKGRDNDDSADHEISHRLESIVNNNGNEGSTDTDSRMEDEE